jgi:hypothetical protein
MSAKHTPGPWSYDPASFWKRPGLRGFKVYGPDSKSIAAYSSAGNRNAEEQEANARLIAAAPDLLAALRELIETAERFADLRGSTDQKALWADLEAARIAIAKAVPK